MRHTYFHHYQNVLLAKTDKHMTQRLFNCQHCCLPYPVAVVDNYVWASHKFRKHIPTLEIPHNATRKNTQEHLLPEVVG